MPPMFFRTGAEFRRWLQKNHAAESELLVGFYRKASGKPSITYPEALDEALCFGWIDGVRKRFGEDSYTVRFTPRKKRSNWSKVNVRRVGELIAAGRMAPSGRSAFEARQPERTGVYSYENAEAGFEGKYGRALRRNKAAWEFFRAQPPYYRRVASWFVMSAKREETRERRLAELIRDSAEGRRIGAATVAKPVGLRVEPEG